MLKISGINSFIEEQVIDFSQLIELGLFGIFGPTGSGKSTILDAITLALYGEIPRSGKDLSGAINSQCDEGNVYYEFEIGSKKDKRRYFVSRSFKKNAQGSVRTQGVKLCDITNIEHPIVLEEKVNAVNNTMAEIIGLKCNDFTRSVVLPQGNFSDFLKLAGREKRNMLERIFFFFLYGSQLNIKIATHKRNVQENYNFIQGKIMGYEGVSQKIFDDLSKETKLLQEQFNIITEQFKKIDQNYEHNKELFGFTKEYQGYMKKNEELKKQEKSIRDAKKQYELAERVKNMQPYIEQKNTIEEKLKAMRSKFKSNKSNLEEVTKVLDATREKWIIQQELKEKRIPQLVGEKSKMEFALGRKQKLGELLKNIGSLEKRHSIYEEQLNIEKNNLKSSSQQIIDLQEKIKEYQEKAESLKISSQYRKKIYQAHGVEKEYKNSQKEEKQLVNNITKIRAELKPLMQQRKQLDGKLQELDINLVKWDQEFRQKGNEIENIQHKNMAATLANNLNLGESCPVCGSKEHPQRAEFIQEENIDELIKTKNALEQKIEKTKIQREEKSKDLQKLENQETLKEGFLKQWQQELKILTELLLELKLEDEALKKELNLRDIEIGIKELEKRESQLEKLQKSINMYQSKKDQLEESRSKDQKDFNNKNNEMIKIQQSQEEMGKQIEEIKTEIKQYCGEKDPYKELSKIKEEMESIEKNYQRLKNEVEKYIEQKVELDKNQRGLKDTLKQGCDDKKEIEKILEKMLFDNDFENLEEVVACFRTLQQREHLKKIIKEYQEQILTVRENMQRLEKRMKGHSVQEEQWKIIQQKREEAKLHLESTKKKLIEKNAARKDMKQKLKDLNKIFEEKKALDHEKGLLDDLEKLFKGNRFVEYISMGQLKYIAREASQELKKITRNRYALELDADGNFIMRDDFNGGVRRGTQTLSGGETFLTSLALALALSSHIQLKGKAPLEFFFLDEGFGTLDSDLLETVMDSLEKLHSEKLSVGLISHVEELKQRIPRKLIIDPAQAGIAGTRVTLERG